MRLGYVDESYNKRYYWFAAALIPEESDADMQRAVLGVPQRYDMHGLSADAELHGYDLFHAANAWKALRDQLGLRIHAYRVGLRALAEANPFVAIVGIDRQRGSDDRLSVDDARAAAVTELLPCIERECIDLGERCLLVFDEERGSTRALVRAVHQHHRSELLSMRNPRIVEAPLTVESHHTPGVQLADLVAFLYHRRFEGLDEHPKAVEVNDRLWRIIEPYVQIIQGPAVRTPAD